MNKNLKIIMLSVGLTGALLCATPVYAGAVRQQDENTERVRQEKREHLENLAGELGLSEEQAEQLRAQKENRRQVQQRLRESMRNVHQALAEELAKEKPDQGKIDSITQDMKKLNSQMIDDRVKSIIDTRNILTPEQYRQFQQKASQMKERKMHPRKGGRMKGGR
ncbi:MAG: periplasmic heavy metal sensor [Candidatus Omnitrophica bacterium]|nr:periplasmic heavy metal sensor [Candidatus Omnitrophota bacterium]